MMKKLRKMDTTFRMVPNASKVTKKTVKLESTKIFRERVRVHRHSYPQQ